METQKSFSFNPTTRTLFITLSIPFSLLISFWAFRTDLSSPFQTQLLTESLNVSKPDSFPLSILNFSVTESTNQIPSEIHGVAPANPPTPRSDQNGIYNDDRLSNATISSSGDLELIGANKSALMVPESAPVTETVVSTSGFEVLRPKSCDVSDGKWVYDETYPLYQGNACPYIDEGFSCEINGRIDREYMKWRWQPNNCNIPSVNYYQEEGRVLPHLNVSAAFKRALTTWASWVDRNLNAKKTLIFFRSSAPSHFSGGEWSSGGHCRESRHPLNHSILPNPPEMNLIVDQIVSQMRTPVTVLNITSLSGLRSDGHPSVYGRRPGLRPPSGGEDCSHWCLPGVPDTWNELLYFYLEQKLIDE